MQIRRFLGNIARTYLAIGALSASAFAVADEYPINNNWGFPPAQGFAPAQGCVPTHGDLGFGGLFHGDNNCCEAPQCSWGYNPPGYFRCCDNGNEGFLDSLRFRFDFLWWRASQEGIALGVEQTLTQFPTGNVTLTERVQNPNFKYDPGFRIGLSTICECVDVGLNWTHFHTKARAHGESEFAAVAPTAPPLSVTEFRSFWEAFGDVVPENQRGRWHLDLDLLDLEIGHKYYVSSCFVLRPHLGLRGARIDQGYRTLAEANNVATDAFFVSETRSKNDFLGIGPRIGLDAEFRIGCGFAIFGQAAGSIVFGKFDRHARELFTNADVEDPFEDFEYHARGSSRRVGRAITDISIGIKWDHCFELCCRQHPFSLALSWEHHGFYNFNNFNFRSGGDPIGFGTDGLAFLTPDIGNSRKHGDLYTQGLTVSAEFGF